MRSLSHLCEVRDDTRIRSRLRRRRRIEHELIEDALAHGWQREVERHQCTIRRLEQLLLALGEPIDGLEATDLE